MKDISFDTGMIELAIQGDKDRVLRFNPSDGNMINGFFNLINEINSKLEEYALKEEKIIKSDLPDLEKAKEKNKLNLEIDSVFRKELDGIFGAGTATLVFENLCTSAITRNGECVFINFIYALLPYFKNEMELRNKKINQIIQENKF